MAVDMTDERFAELVSDALDDIPPEFARAMNNVAIVIEPHNVDDPDILGLYHGIALTKRTHEYGGQLPDTISIYREPILDMCESENEVIDEVAVTVVHEIGHHFGIDDDRLHELGWG